MAMACAKTAASFVEGFTVPLANRKGCSILGVLMLLISALLSCSTSGLTRKVIYHFNESAAVLQGMSVLAIFYMSK